MADPGARLEFMARTPVVAAAIGDAVGAVGAAAAAAAYAGSTQTKFSVDPEEAQKLITGLEAAKEKLRELHIDSEELRNAGSPGKDPYSGIATLAIREAAGNKPGGYGRANEDARQALQDTIDRIKEVLASYKQTDDGARDALKPKG